MKQRKPSEVPDSLKNIELSKILRRRGVFMRQKQNRELKEKAMPLAKQMLKKKVKKAEPVIHAQFSNEAIQAYYEKQIRLVDVIEDKFQRKVEQFINRVVDSFVAHLDDEVKNKKFDIKKFEAKGYFEDNSEHLIAQAELDFTPLLESVATLAGQQAIEFVGSDDVYIPLSYKDELRKNVAKFAGSMLETDQDKLAGIITEGLEKGKSIPDIEAMIKTEFGQYSKMQAERITRTEVLRASNQAAIDAYKQSGVVEGLQWFTAGATDECADYEGKIEKLSSDGFYSTDNEFQDGYPPLHPNCRCVVLGVVV